MKTGTWEVSGVSWKTVFISGEIRVWAFFGLLNTNSRSNFRNSRWSIQCDRQYYFRNLEACRVFITNFEILTTNS